MIGSVAVLAATHCVPNVTVSTVAGHFEYHSIGAVLRKSNIDVTDLPVTISWYKMASKKVVVTTVLPSGLGMSLGISSLTFP